MPIDYGRRLPLDPRMVQKIQRSPEMMAEQGDFLSDWGGPAMYQLLAELPTNQRMTYLAVYQGLTTSEEISIATDLPVGQVESALTSLGKRGLIEITPTELQ